MNVVLSTSQFNKDYVHYQEPVRNTVMDDSNFIRIIYSNDLFALNGIFLQFSLYNAKIERYFAKYKCTFDYSDNRAIVSQLIRIEEDIIKLTAITNKRPAYKIREQLQGGGIKLFANENDERVGNSFLLKISGIWETASEIGITFKFIDSQHT